MKPLTEIMLRNATVPSGVTRSGRPRKDMVLRDGDCTGFCCRVSRSGSRVFFAEYTAPAGKRRVRIGEHGPLSVAQARARAKEILGVAASGSDPFADRVAAQAVERVQAYTLGKLIEAWGKGRADQGRQVTYLRIATQAMRNHLAPWLNRPAASLTSQEAVQRLDEVRASVGPTAANRLLSYTRAAYGWGVKRQLLTANPFGGLEAPGATRSRDRVLSAVELRKIWHATDALPLTHRGFVRFLMLTLARRDEVAGLRWSELRDTWTLPAERSKKNRKAHVTHLSAPVRDVLAAMPRINECPWVFPGDGLKGPLKGYSYIKRQLDTLSGVTDWVFHDFRRSGVTQLAGMGHAPHIADRLLNHATGTLSAIALVYQRGEFLPERAAALDAWAKHVTGIAP